MLFIRVHRFSKNCICIYHPKSFDYYHISIWVYAREKEGMFVGFLSGLLVDIFFNELIGFYALIFMVIGYVNGFFKRIFYAEDIKLPLILIAASDFIYAHIVYIFLFIVRSRSITSTT